MSQQSIGEARNLIKASSFIVAFTGAGISVESGIPDFRSPGGLWERFDPQIYAEYSSFLRTPEKYWTMHSVLSNMIRTAQPNPAHVALAKLEKENKLKGIITQNVDFLHQRAGNTNICELHGSGETAKCIDCKDEYSNETVDQFLKTVKVPRCVKCNGLIKPDTILFNEPLPIGVFLKARELVEKADLLIVIGSSITVYPAASLPYLAQRTGTRIIVVNDESTHLSTIADVYLEGKAGEILPLLMNFEEKY
ncbi:MAG: SIR2 family NAD-dependent protein deacylase [Candidatus Hodarchaeales archaeon]|jgi:NAD-dependent deacetylase